MMALESINNRYLDARASRNCSEQTSTIVDEEFLAIIRTAHKEARTILSENKDLLDEISNVLLEKETIMGDEFMEIVYGKYPEKREAYEKAKYEKEMLRELAMAKRREKEEAIQKAREEALKEEAVELIDQVQLTALVDLDCSNAQEGR